MSELISKVEKERKLDNLAAQVDKLIRSIVRSVEQLNYDKGIKEVNRTHKYFKESHPLISEIGYSYRWEILKFNILLRKASWWSAFYKGESDVYHTVYWDWRSSNSNYEASVEEYESLVLKLQGYLKEFDK